MHIMLFIFSLIIFTIPGVLLVSISKLRFQADTIFIACIIGMILSCFISALIGFLWEFRPLFIALSLIIISILLFLYKIIQRYFFKRANVNGNYESFGSKWTKQDYLILSIFLIITIVLTIIPHSNIGKETEHGIAYTYLIDNDFLQHSAIASEITKGIPPQNIYFSGELFQYHWLSHVFPAFIYAISSRNMATQDILVWVLRYYTILFVCILFSLVKVLFKNWKVQAFIMFLALCSYSYNGIYVLFKPLMQSYENIFPWLSNINHFSNISNGYFRSFVVEPHTILALSASLTVIIIMIYTNYQTTHKKIISSLLGLLLGITLGIEGFIGMTMLLWFFVTYFYIIFKHKDRGKGIKGFLKALFRTEFLVLLIIVLAIISAMFLLNIFTFKKGVLILQPYFIIIVLAPIYFLLEYGTIFILALNGLVLYLRKKFEFNLMPIFLLALISIILIFFVRHFAEPNHILLRSGKVLQIPMIILSGVFLNHYSSKTKHSMISYLLLFIAFTPGLLTLFTDVYYLANIHNSHNTTYVNIADYRACKWIKENTPLDAVIQSKPEYSSTLSQCDPYFEYSLISMFAERRMAVGDSLHASIYQIGKDKYQERKRDIKVMFTTSNINESIKIINKYVIDYLYSGPIERSAYGSGMLKFANTQDLFKQVYSEDGIIIYKIQR